MHILLEIPQEFEDEFRKDNFAEFLRSHRYGNVRIKLDDGVDDIAESIRKDQAIYEMLLEAFQNASECSDNAVYNMVFND